VSRIRLGFVGVGNMGQCAHLKNYVSLPDCEVVAISELRPELGAAVGRRYNIPKVFTSAQDMLKQEKLDGIVASQPFARHAAIVPELLELGIPVLIEKPIASSIPSAHVILDAARKPGAGKLYIGYHKRSDPATIRAKQQIAQWQTSGAAGKLKYVRINIPPGDWIAGGFTDLIKSDETYPWQKTDPMPAGWDEARSKQYLWFVNYYIHQINLLRHLLGEGYKVTFADPSGVLLVAQSDSGVTGVIEMSTHQTTIDWQEEAFVAFEKAWIKLELTAPIAAFRCGKLTIFSDPGDGAEPTTSTPTLPWTHPMRQQAIHFVAACRGEKTPLCEASEALADLEASEQYLTLFNQRRE